MTTLFSITHHETLEVALVLNGEALWVLVTVGGAGGSSYRFGIAEARTLAMCLGVVDELGSSGCDIRLRVADQRWLGAHCDGDGVSVYRQSQKDGLAEVLFLLACGRLTPISRSLFEATDSGYELLKWRAAALSGGHSGSRNGGRASRWPARFVHDSGFTPGVVGIGIERKAPCRRGRTIKAGPRKSVMKIKLKSPHKTSGQTRTHA